MGHKLIGLIRILLRLYGISDGPEAIAAKASHQKSCKFSRSSFGNRTQVSRTHQLPIA